MKARPNGFSLVEVALALAILSVAMVGVLALLPVGLDSARQVYAETVATSIAQTGISNLRMTQTNANWSIATTPSYFTYEGKETTSAGTGFYSMRFQAGNQSTRQCRVFVYLNWPCNAPVTAPMAQQRVFVTDLVK